MKKQVEYWLTQSDNDLTVAESVLEKGALHLVPVHRASCFGKNLKGDLCQRTSKNCA